MKNVELFHVGEAPSEVKCESYIIQTGFKPSPHIYIYMSWRWDFEQFQISPADDELVKNIELCRVGEAFREAICDS